MLMPTWLPGSARFLCTGAILIPMAVLATSSTLSLDLKLTIPVSLGGLFICCVFRHGELAARKPATGHLTGFYLLISRGGAVGAWQVGVVAPNVLPGYYEPGLGRLGVALLLPCNSSGKSPRGKGWDERIPHTAHYAI